MKLFILISTLIILLSTGMIFLKTPINSALCLCTVLLLSTIILFLFHIEFLAYIFIMVYVGGIALLFLFIIIMINLKIDYIKNKESFRLLSGPIILFIIILKIQSSLALNIDFFTQLKSFNMKQLLKVHHFLSNDIMGFGFLLYTHYFYNFLVVGTILLFVMLGVLEITLDD